MVCWYLLPKKNLGFPFPIRGRQSQGEPIIQPILSSKLRESERNWKEWGRVPCVPFGFASDLASPTDIVMRFRLNISLSSDMWTRTCFSIEADIKWIIIYRWVHNLVSHQQIGHLTSVADPGFPRGGGANSPGGAPTYDFAKISQKLHEIERIWAPGGGRASKILLCRSATGHGPLFTLIFTNI